MIWVRNVDVLGPQSDLFHRFLVNLTYLDFLLAHMRGPCFASPFWVWQPLVGGGMRSLP